ncbi:MAG: S49 family peptidase [Bullifex sp.]
MPKNNEIELPQMLFADVDALARYRAGYARVVSEYWGSVSVSDGIMYIPVIGSLFASAYDSSWLNMSYTEIENAVNRALADDEVSQVVFLIDSPGGEADGVFSLVDKILKCGKEKKTTALIARLGASAAYLIASSCSEVIIEPDAMTGSCGAVCTYSMRDPEWLKENFGYVSKTFVSKCSPKKRCSPLTDEEAAAEAQAMVDALGEKYLQTVADNRGMSLEEAKKKCGQGKVVDAEYALSAGMVDKIETFDTFITNLIASLQSEEEEGADMDVTKMTSEEKKALFDSLIASDPQLLAPEREGAVTAERERIVKLSALKKGDAEYDAIVDDAISKGMSETELKVALFDFVQTHPQSETKKEPSVLNILASSDQGVNPANADTDEFDKFFGPISRSKEE